MKNIKDIIYTMCQIPKYTSYSFSMSMVVFIIVGMIVGMEEMSISMIIQLLIICIIAAILQMIAFTDIFIKKLLYTKRLSIFMFPFLVVITGFAVKYNWFPIRNMGSWSLFIGIFVTCFIVSTILFEIHFKITGDKYTGILNEYKNRKNKENY